MTALLLLLALLQSAAFYIAAQFRRDALPMLLYLSGMLLTCLAYFLLERRRRRQMADRITHILDGAVSGFPHSAEDELSADERLLMLRLKDTETREANIRASYRSIAELVSDIAHQCKTPLSSVILHAELLEDSECAAVIRGQAEKLSFLLDSLTKLSKCESGLISDNLHPQKNDIRELICRAVTDVYPAAEEKSIRITTDIPNELCAVFDLRWTAEAIFNLLDNAVKYTPAGGSVDIRTVPYDLFVRIDVADNGCGIPEDEICSIWKRFFRGKNAGDRGVGIGLYLCSRILNAQGGRVSVRSSPGQGSVFSVYLPMG
ncbi:MAG: sensor histidine kinase [Eubacteriales bacterium]